MKHRCSPPPWMCRCQVDKARRQNREFVLLLTTIAALAIGIWGVIAVLCCSKLAR